MIVFFLRKICIKDIQKHHITELLILLSRYIFYEILKIDIQNSTMGELAVLAEPSILSLENNKEEENVFSNRYFRMNILIKKPNIVITIDIVP